MYELNRKSRSISENYTQLSNKHRSQETEQSVHPEPQVRLPPLSQTSPQVRTTFSRLLQQQPSTTENENSPSSLPVLSQVENPLYGKGVAFNDLFQPSRGDFIFGLTPGIREHTSYWSKLMRRGDYFAIYLYPQDALNVVDDIQNYNGNINLYYPAIDAIEQYNAKPDEERSEDDYEEAQKLSIFVSGLNESIKSTEDKFNDALHKRQSGFFLNEKNKTFIKKYIIHLKEHGKYSILGTIFNYGDTTTEDGLYKLARKVISRGSKAALSLLLQKNNEAHIHFILDGIDMMSLVTKQDNNSYTGSELRYLYRHRDEIERVHFYLNKCEVDAPWVSNSYLWANYHPNKESVHRVQ